MRFTFLILVSLLALFTSERSRAAEGEAGLLQLHTYKPLYFLMGTSYTKIQLSFETQVVENVPVYFGYSQLMMWQLFVKSPYFYDLNYNPLAWYRFHLGDSNDHWIDAIPYEHESNGKGGSLERSWNRVGVAYHRKLVANDATTLYLDLKAWAITSTNSNNSDIAKYRGLWEAQFTLSKFLGSYFEFNDLSLRIYPGGKLYLDPTHGGQELQIRLRGGGRKFLPLSVVQVFHGFGEYMQDYQDSHWGVRAGFGF